MSTCKDPKFYVTKNSLIEGADLGAVKTCEMCKQGLLVDLDDFNVTDFYRKHQQSRVRATHTTPPPGQSQLEIHAGRTAFPDKRTVDNLAWDEFGNVPYAHFSEKLWY